MNQVLHHAVTHAAAAHTPTMYESEVMGLFHGLGMVWPWILGLFLFLWLLSLRHTPEMRRKLDVEFERDNQEFWDRLEEDEFLDNQRRFHF